MKSLIRRIEKQKSIKVVWVGLKGSKLKGYAADYSDTDYICIFVPSNGITDYLTFEKKNNLDNFTIQQESMDLQFINLRTAIELCIKNDVNLLQAVLCQNNLLNEKKLSQFDILLQELVLLTYEPTQYLSKMQSQMYNFINKPYLARTDKDFISAGLIYLTLANNYTDQHTYKIPPIWADNLIIYARSLGGNVGYLASLIRKAIDNRKAGGVDLMLKNEWDLLIFESKNLPKIDKQEKPLSYKTIDNLFIRMVNATLTKYDSFIISSTIGGMG